MNFYWDCPTCSTRNKGAGACSGCAAPMRPHSNGKVGFAPRTEAQAHGEDTTTNKEAEVGQTSVPYAPDGPPDDWRKGTRLQ